MLGRVLSLFLLATAQLSYATRLVDFQVAQPPIVPAGAKKCTVKVLERAFAHSYGAAEVVHLDPPTACGEPGSWSAVTLNFTVTSNGTQYDRLGVFTFQNIEIWRTSTPEPTTGDGIIWNYVKDVTRYTPLFATPGTFILELDNVIQAGLDGIYSTVLYANYYASSPASPPAAKADLLVPISNLKNDTGNFVSVPPGFSLNVTLPRNSVKAFAELYASGNSNEEFWYYNLPNKYASGQDGPFREVRLLVDGQLAGAAYPYATIFTGGIIPSSWRPIVAYGALDLPTYFLDVTPFIPILADGNPHNITIDVASVEADHSIQQNWFLSGNLQVYLDDSSEPTTGNITLYTADPFSQSSTVGNEAGNNLDVTVTASRKVHIEATIVGGSGKVNQVVFTQDLQFSNTQHYTDSTQNVVQTASGNVLSTHNGVPTLIDTFSYPLNINYSSVDPFGSTIRAIFDHSYNRDLLPLPTVSRSNITELQSSIGFWGSVANGTSHNVFSYSDTAGHTYSRKVDAALNRITHDEEAGTLAGGATPGLKSGPGSVNPSGGQLVRKPRFRTTPGS